MAEATLAAVAGGGGGAMAGGGAGVAVGAAADEVANDRPQFELLHGHPDH